MTSLSACPRDTYEGYTNRETWAVALHVNNDQGLQAFAHELVTRPEGAAGETVDATEASRRLADWFRELRSEALDLVSLEVSTSSLDMLLDIGSLWRVDWDSLEATFLADALECLT